MAAAVVLTRDIPCLQDSKLLSAKKREALNNLIIASSIYSVGWVAPQYVDAHGLTAAVRLAMVQAIDGIPTASYSEIIIDGGYNFLAEHSPNNSRAIVRADGSVAAVSASSIVAKVARDGYMRQQSLLYPDYGFESHVGYGTLRHSQALARFGICPLHRMSYRPIKTIMESMA